MGKGELVLYRQALRTLKALPESHQGPFKKKLAYNYREMFETLRHAPLTFKEEMYGRLEKDIPLLHEVFSLSPELLTNIFPQFIPVSAPNECDK